MRARSRRAHHSRCRHRWTQGQRSGPGGRSRSAPGRPGRWPPSTVSARSGRPVRPPSPARTDRGDPAARRRPPAPPAGRRRAGLDQGPGVAAPTPPPTTARCRRGRCGSPPGCDRPVRRTAAARRHRAGVTTRPRSRSWSSSARARLGRDLGPDPGDRLGVEAADGRQVDRQAPPQGHRVGAAVDGLVVVEEGVGLGGEDLVGEHRRLGGVAAVDLAPRRTRCRRAGSSARRCRGASVSVSCIVWRTSGWSGISIGPVTFSWQAAAWGKRAAMRSSASMRWMRRRVAPPALPAQHDERPVQVPAPAAQEHRRRASRTACSQHLPHRARS